MAEMSIISTRAHSRDLYFRAHSRNLFQGPFHGPILGPILESFQGNFRGPIEHKINCVDITEARAVSDHCGESLVLGKFTVLGDILRKLIMATVC